MADTFKHRHVYADPGPLPTCTDCGATAEVDWVEVTDFSAEPGVHYFVRGGSRYLRCPNGPHTFIEQARRG